VRRAPLGARTRERENGGKIGGMETFGKARPAPFRPRPFRPAWWLPGAHAQTVCGRLLRRPRPPAFRRERLELPDGDFIDLDHPPMPPDAAGLVLLVHGLEGSARRGYAVNVYNELATRRIGAVGLNFRSCSGEPNRLARSYHSGDTGDILHVLQVLAERHPQLPRGAIGFSLGGNALLKLLGELGPDARPLVQAAAAVSVPYELAAGADALDRTWAGRAYTSRFLKTLVGKVEAKAALLVGTCELDRVRAARSFRAFDDAATAPLHGFASADEYYARSSSRQYLRRPTRSWSCSSPTPAGTSASSRDRPLRRASGPRNRPAAGSQHGCWLTAAAAGASFAAMNKRTVLHRHHAHHHGPTGREGSV
jgi:uncharacterized protein